MPPVTTSETQEPTSATSSILKERRFKLSRACDRCRRRRIKCDEGHPCQACLSASSACTFEEPGKRTHPHKSKRTATLEERMNHLESLIQAIPPAVLASVAGVTNLTSNSLSSPISYPGFPAGIPPPSLHTFPLTNPSTHFLNVTNGELKKESGSQSPLTAFNSLFNTRPAQKIPSLSGADQLAEDTARMSLSATYLYIDDEGYTRWQGETSGLPLLDLLLERHPNTTTTNRDDGSPQPGEASSANPPSQDWFPNRTARRTDANPQVLWRAITSHIVPELMDSLVQCFLSTTYYILPFLHVPTFLSDYGNPQKWGEPGFAAFVVAICCLASRHVDDPRVRADPADGISSGIQWFELLGRLRTLPIADRPTLYTIQADLIAAVYAVGLGRLSKAAALLSEAITTSIDAGLHRSSDTYDYFDPIEEEVRKRTFWCVYIWDKQLGAHFGRPPMIRLRDCDVGEPAAVDDEYITKDGIGIPPPGVESRISPFIVFLRILVVLESVLDISPPRHPDVSSPFLMRAAASMARKGFVELREEEALLDDIHNNIPPYWSHTPETLASEDTIRVTQAERLHCAEHFVRLLIYRHRFSQLFAERTGPGHKPDEDIGDAEREAMISAHNSALQIITTHLLVAKKGLMTYYGVHVIHQLTQAGRTLVAVLLNCKSEALQHLIPSGLEAVRSCVGLLRKFSGRYVCGLRSGDLMEEFCRLTQIPLEPTRQDNPQNNSRPAWIRPVRKKTSSVQHGPSEASQHSSPESFSQSEFLTDLNPTTMFPTVATSSGSSAALSQAQFGKGSPASPSPSFVDALSMDQLIRDEAQMYMSPEVLAMFDGGPMFSPDFSGQALPSDGSNGTVGTSSSFADTSYLKMNGLVPSP